MNVSQLQRELMEQPEVLQRLLDKEEANIQNIAEVIRQKDPGMLMLAARGSSDNAARYGQYLFGAFNRLPVALATPSLFTLYKRPPTLKNVLTLAISQSGQSPDILAVTEEARRQGTLAIGITNDIQSPLANLSSFFINLHCGEERSIAATKTYTSSLLALAMLSTALAQDEKRREELKLVPYIVSRTLQQADLVLGAASLYEDVEACVVIGRGFNYSTAFEIALKLKELTYVLAEPYSSADFQHGPVALVEKGFLVIAVIPEGTVAPELINFLDGLHPRKPRLVIISPEEKALGYASTPIPIPGGIPEWLSPLAAVIAGQLFALGLTIAKGLDPDHPRGLRKVTLTR